MESHICNHPHVAHTAWVWVSDNRPGMGPQEMKFDDLHETMLAVTKLFRRKNSRLRKVRVFRSDNELYTCFSWDSEESERLDDGVEHKVQMEIDMEPMKAAFDNVSTGFKEQGSAIRQNQFVLGVLSFLMILNFIMDVIS